MEDLKNQKDTEQKKVANNMKMIWKKPELSRISFFLTNNNTAAPGADGASYSES